MNERVKKLTDEIRRLTPEEQADLMDELVVLTHQSTDPSRDKDFEKAWSDEIERRIGALERGEEELLDADAVLAELRSRRTAR